jgi:hypothetical protein
MGWGIVPWDALAACCAWPEGVIAELKIEPRHRAAHREAVAARHWTGRPWQGCG